MLSAELLTLAFCSWEWGSLILSNLGETLDDSPRTSRHFLYGFNYFSSCGSEENFLHMVLPWSLASVSWNCTPDLLSLPQTWSWFILIDFLATSERCPTLNCFSCRHTHGLEVWNKQTNKQTFFQSSYSSLAFIVPNCIFFKGNKQEWFLLLSASVLKEPVAGSCGGEGSWESSVNGLESRTGGDAESEPLPSRRPCKPHVAATS